MSFSEDLERYRDELLRMVDAGVPVVVASRQLGLSESRGRAILRALGRGQGPRPRLSPVQETRIVELFVEFGSVARAARTVGVSHAAARRVLVEAGLVARETTPRGKG